MFYCDCLTNQINFTHQQKYLFIVKKIKCKDLLIKYMEGLVKKTERESGPRFVCATTTASQDRGSGGAVRDSFVLKLAHPKTPKTDRVVYALIEKHAPWVSDHHKGFGDDQEIVMRFFQRAQEAHWDYCDDKRHRDRLEPLKFKDFVCKFFGVFKPSYVQMVPKATNDFSKHMRAVPVCCVAAIGADGKLPLVRGVGDEYWMFPGGKQWVFDNETTKECAKREMREETGVDVSDLLENPDTPTMVFLQGGRKIHLFILTDISHPENMKPQTPKEISGIKQFSHREIIEQPNSFSKTVEVAIRYMEERGVFERYSKLSQ